ncbi:ABC transporter ATP-binding protein [Paenibacillus sp.]|uniref:ABC transporter ATP-binding protein n=1 Tax=Paenibacillus sp. TaxID=58172 RepID=UPI003464A10F
MNVIKLSNLTKRYGVQRGIDDVNLEVKQGEIFGFIGPNGAGKSTTLRTMMQLLRPTTGTVELFGEVMRRERPDVRRKIGYLPSEVHYNEDVTGKEVLDFAARMNGLSLQDTHAMNLAERLKLDVSKRVKSYSLGNRKKLGIVQCLLHQPDLIVLDEPTSGLDPLMQHTFFQILKEYHDRGATIFFSTHILSEVEKLCSRVAFIREGKLLRVCEVDAIPGKDQRIAHVQFKRQGDCIEAYQLRDIDPDAVYDGIEHRLLLQGDLHLALQRIAAYELKDVRIEQPSLEELFMAEYDVRGNGGIPAQGQVKQLSQAKHSSERTEEQLSQAKHQQEETEEQSLQIGHSRERSDERKGGEA